MNRREGERVTMKKKSIFRIILFIVLIVVLQPSVSAEAKTKISKSSVTLGIGKTYDLRITDTKKKVSWSASKKAVTVKKLTKTGTKARVKAVKAGKAVVTAKIGNKRYRCKVNVVNPKLNTSSVTLKTGQTYTLKMSGGTGKIVWSSGNSAIAGVSKGKISAKKSGTVTISAKQNGITKKCRVTVQASNSKPDNGGSNTGNNTGKKEEWESFLRKEEVIEVPDSFALKMKNISGRNLGNVILYMNFYDAQGVKVKSVLGLVNGVQAGTDTYFYFKKPEATYDKYDFTIQKPEYGDKDRKTELVIEKTEIIQNMWARPVKITVLNQSKEHRLMFDTLTFYYKNGKCVGLNKNVFHIIDPYSRGEYSLVDTQFSYNQELGYTEFDSVKVVIMVARK